MMDAGVVLGIVGIGASAGGLEALQKVISSLQAQSALCYVVAQHLSPTHTSMLRELLARGTPLTVRELTDGETPTLGTILIIPPNADVELREGRLRLLQPEHPIGPKPSVDRKKQVVAFVRGDDITDGSDPLDFGHQRCGGCDGGVHPQ